MFGKPLNVEKARIDRVLGNDKLLPLITALGTSLGEEYDFSKLRYGKVIIMADADVDGSHIRILIMTFFFRYMRELIERGGLFLAQPPLFLVKKGKQERYAFTMEERDQIVREMSSDGEGRGVMIQRYKGLGEMNPLQLRETTMAPDTRRLVQLHVGESAETRQLLDMLLAKKRSSDRRQWLEKCGDRADLV